MDSFIGRNLILGVMILFSTNSITVPHYTAPDSPVNIHHDTIVLILSMETPNINKLHKAIWTVLGLSYEHKIQIPFITS